jgi:thymidylate kinase
MWLKSVGFTKFMKIMAAPNMIITLEGNIGAGKRTIARSLFEHFLKHGIEDCSYTRITQGVS